ncbi:hypothetical protein QEH52_19920 [Coraliomargarita sp. SDUM461003]|uniref:Uncharacterized protein n=1 Tax=Thalassobacterium maritimum TaxID=3041265 RepID=A0ABU1B2Y6_9BACT|nr:hypothetical protein [Coraliomargarita sp. SDUM461003]MDQ8209797.1 hypothetical protein [Coraliomargarita sp. SDUM461003]
MKKQKLDGILFIALGMIPFGFLFMFGGIVVVTKVLVMQSHGPDYSIEAEGYPQEVTLLALVSKNTGIAPDMQLLIAFVISGILIINGIVNLLPAKNKKSEPGETGQSH